MLGSSHLLPSSLFDESGRVLLENCFWTIHETSSSLLSSAGVLALREETVCRGGVIAIVVRLVTR